MGKTLLIVDDSELMREYVKVVAEKKFGNEISTYLMAKNGEEAMKLAADAKPDLAIVDLIMPGMSGQELCRHLKQAYNDLPILVVTASKDPEVKRELIEDIGVEKYLEKPLDNSDLYFEMHRSLFGKMFRLD